MPGIKSRPDKEQEAFCAEVGAYWLQCLELPGYSLHDATLYGPETPAGEDVKSIFKRYCPEAHWKPGNGTQVAAIKLVFDWISKAKTGDATKLLKRYHETKAVAAPALVAKPIAAAPALVAKPIAAAAASAPTAAPAAPVAKPRTTATSAAAAAASSSSSSSSAAPPAESKPKGRGKRHASDSAQGELLGGSSSGGGSAYFVDREAPNTQEVEELEEGAATAAAVAESVKAEAAAKVAEAETAAKNAAKIAKKGAELLKETRPEKKKAAKEQETLDKQRVKFLDEASPELCNVLYENGIVDDSNLFVEAKFMTVSQLPGGVKTRGMLVKLGMVLVSSWAIAATLNRHSSP